MQPNVTEPPPPREMTSWANPWLKNEPSCGALWPLRSGVVTLVLIILNPCCKHNLCAEDSSWNITQQQNIKAFIKSRNKVERLAARIDQMISDVGPNEDV